MRGIDTFHQSTLSSYAFYGCPRHTFWESVKQFQPEKRSPKAIIGSAVHNMLHKINSGEHIIKTEEAIHIFPYNDIFTWAFDDAINKPHNSEEAEIPVNWYPDEETQLPPLRDEAIRMVKGFIDHAPKHEVLLSEAPFAIDLGKYHWEGTIDQVWEMPDGKVLLVDFKTTGMGVPHDDLIVESYQFGLYALALQGIDLRIDGFAWVHLRDYLTYKYNEKFNETTGELELKPQNYYKDALAQGRNEILQKWIENTALKQTDAGKYVFRSDMMKGPGVYAYAATDDWLNSREELLVSVAGMLSQVNPVPVPSERCMMCRFKTACRQEIHKLPVDHVKIDEETEQQLKTYQQFFGEENA